MTDDKPFSRKTGIDQAAAVLNALRGLSEADVQRVLDFARKLARGESGGSDAQG